MELSLSYLVGDFDVTEVEHKIRETIKLLSHFAYNSSPPIPDGGVQFEDNSEFFYALAEFSGYKADFHFNFPDKGFPGEVSVHVEKEEGATCEDIVAQLLSLWLGEKDLEKLDYRTLAGKFNTLDIYYETSATEGSDEYNFPFRNLK